MKRLVALALTVCSATMSAVQDRTATPPAGLDRTFEAATIKRSQRGGDQPGTYRLNGRTFITANTSLRDLIKFAYGVHASQIVNAPAWVGAEPFDIEGVSEGEGLPNELQWKRMLQKLLADRFRLTFHREPRELPAFVIVLGNGQPTLTTTKADPNSLTRSAISFGRYEGVNAAITHLANALQGVAMDRPVVDHTGMTGRFDFTLAWTPDLSQFGGRDLTTGSERNRPPALSTAIQEQLGLKLESRRVAVDVLVVDTVERPSEN